MNTRNHWIGLPLLGAVMALAACSAPPPYKGPPPVYEPPRAFPGASSSAAAEVPDVEPPTYGTAEELGSNVDAFMAGYGAKWGEAYAPAGILVVAHDGKPVLVRAYGKADRDKGTAFSIDTRLRIGSLTKQFTAAAILKLAEGNKLKTTDSVRKWVAGLPETYEPVTLHHLLSQTSGVPSYTDDPSWLERKTQDIPQSEFVAWFAKHGPDYAPGARFAYSNSNYYLLTLVAEKASGKKLDAFLSESVVGPAGMKATSLDPTADAAIGYTRDPQGIVIRADNVHDSVPLGAGYLRSSARDLITWDRALVGTSVLNDASKAALFTPGVKCPECGGADYAYGWIIESIGGTQVDWHNGKIDGYNSFFARVPDKGLSIVLLSNSFNFDATAAGRAVLAMSLLGKPVPPPVERELVKLDEGFAKSFVGTYIIAKEDRETLKSKLPPQLLESIEGMEVKWEGGALLAKPTGQSWFPLRKAADGAVFNNDFMIDLLPDFGAGAKPEKKAKGFTLKQASFTVKYVRGKLPKPKAKPAAAKPKAEPATPKAEPAKPKAEPAKPKAEPSPKKGG